METSCRWKEDLFATGISVGSYLKPFSKGLTPKVAVESESHPASRATVTAKFRGGPLVQTGGRANRTVRALATKLRLSGILEGLIYMKFFLSTQYGFYGAWYNHPYEAREGLATYFCDVVTKDKNGFRVSVDSRFILL